MALPTVIPGAQHEILVLDNIMRRILQKQILQALSGDKDNAAEAEVEVRQIEHHLEIAFGFADLVLDRLRGAGLTDLAEKWLKTWTGHLPKVSA